MPDLREKLTAAEAAHRDAQEAAAGLADAFAAAEAAYDADGGDEAWKAREQARSKSERAARDVQRCARLVDEARAELALEERREDFARAAHLAALGGTRVFVAKLRSAAIDELCLLDLRQIELVVVKALAVLREQNEAAHELAEIRARHPKMMVGHTVKPRTMEDVERLIGVALALNREAHGVKATVFAPIVPRPAAWTDADAWLSVAQALEEGDSREIQEPANDAPESDLAGGCSEPDARLGGTPHQSEDGSEDDHLAAG